jgi:hypothetical protein
MPEESQPQQFLAPRVPQVPGLYLGSWGCLLSEFFAFVGTAFRGAPPPLVLDWRSISSSIPGLYARRLITASRRANFSSHRIRPVICITTNSDRIVPIVMAKPVNPWKKNAYENKTR